MSLVERLNRGFVPVWWVTGPVGASALVARAANTLVAWGRERCGPTAFNLSAVYADEADPASLMALARTVPMMGELRVVVVQRLESATEEMVLALVAYAARPCPSTLLVLVGPKPERSSRKKDAVDPGPLLTAAVRAGKGEIVSFDPASVSPMEHARARAQELGRTLEPRAARLLVEVVGADLSLLEREVEKLATFVEGAVIDEAAVGECATLLAEAQVWDLTAAIAGRDPARAVVALQRLMADGDAPHRLLAMVNWQMRQVLVCVAALRAGASADEASRVSQLRRELVGRIDPTLVQGRGFDAAAVVERLAATNHAMNSLRVGGAASFEALVLELATPR